MVSTIGNYIECRFGKTSASSLQPHVAIDITKNSHQGVLVSIMYFVQVDRSRIYNGVH